MIMIKYLSIQSFPTAKSNTYLKKSSTLDERLVKRGAVLFRNLAYHVPDSIAFSKLIAGLGERMPYIAGMATREEMDQSPGVMNASDDPEECTLEPHLEMCYREEMPSK